MTSTLGRAVGERVEGQQPSRLRSLAAAAVAGLFNELQRRRERDSNPADAA